MKAKGKGKYYLGLLPCVGSLVRGKDVWLSGEKRYQYQKKKVCIMVINLLYSTGSSS